ncbi:MAG: hypothetical protein LBG74_00585 [Spirochaetaceae bacterium]|jgi:hypothetical protein|nr:hypothetical protein [Spirochaetaceae bacterium]
MKMVLCALAGVWSLLFSSCIFQSILVPERDPEAQQYTGTARLKSLTVHFSDSSTDLCSFDEKDPLATYTFLAEDGHSNLVAAAEAVEGAKVQIRWTRGGFSYDGMEQPQQNGEVRNIEMPIIGLPTTIIVEITSGPVASTITITATTTPIYLDTLELHYLSTMPGGPNIISFDRQVFTYQQTLVTGTPDQIVFNAGISTSGVTLTASVDGTEVPLPYSINVPAVPTVPIDIAVLLSCAKGTVTYTVTLTP